MSAGWDAAVTRAARAFYDAFPTVRSTRRRGPEPQSFFDLPDHAQRTWKSHARAALTAAVGPGGLILETEDVAILRNIVNQLDDPVGATGVVGDLEPQGLYDFWAKRADLDRLRALLDSREGAG